MPPYLTPPYFSLSRLPLTTKIGLTCFQVMILGALLFAAFGIFQDRTQFDPERAHANYRGAEALSPETQDRMVKQNEPFPAQKSPRERMDIVHPHSFLMPILYFILLHLMEMTRTPRGVKIALYVAGFAGTVGVILAPWMAVDGGRAGGAAVVASVIALLATYAAMILVPMVEMWRPAAAPSDATRSA